MSRNPRHILTSFKVSENKTINTAAVVVPGQCSVTSDQETQAWPRLTDASSHHNRKHGDSPEISHHVPRCASTVEDTNKVKVEEHSGKSADRGNPVYCAQVNLTLLPTTAVGIRSLAWGVGPSGEGNTNMV